MLHWWHYVQHHLEQKEDNPLVLWVSAPTILYPPRFQKYLNMLLEPLVYGETLQIGCHKMHRHRPDQFACQKLLGRVVLISYEVLQASSSCWNCLLAADPNSNGLPSSLLLDACWKQYDHISQV
jgi:hypothetical protein